MEYLRRKEAATLSPHGGWRTRP